MGAPAIALVAAAVMFGAAGWLFHRVSRKRRRALGLDLPHSELMAHRAFAVLLIVAGMMLVVMASQIAR